MIVATVTALIILFSGGYEIFFAENVEKGIKQHVLDKDRRKELLDMTKEIKKDAKTYNKERKANFKNFDELCTTFDTSEEELVTFFNNLTEIQKTYQSDFIDKRIELTEKITDDEWELILQSSEEAYQKKLDKLAKKKSKDKDPYEKTRKKIAEVSDLNSRESLLMQLDAFTEKVSGFEKSMKDVNVLENELLTQKSKSKQELLTLFDDMNEIRQEAFNQVIGFHQSVNSHVSEEQGTAILKSFYKDMELAPM